MSNTERTIWLLGSISAVALSGVIGYRLSTHFNDIENQGAQSRCYSTKHSDAYVAKVGPDDFVCFREDYHRKKITKSLIVLPDRALE
jgi:hypothetical protein